VAPLALMNAARETIAKRDASIAMRFTTMDEMLSESLATERFRAALIGVVCGSGASAGDAGSLWNRGVHGGAEDV
jgi:hypothetical protein